MKQRTVLDRQEEIQRHRKKPSVLKGFSALLLGLVFGRLLEVEHEEAEATPKALRTCCCAGEREKGPSWSDYQYSIMVLDSLYVYGHGVVRHLHFK